jgi:hypothetical protein
MKSIKQLALCLAVILLVVSHSPFLLAAVVPTLQNRQVEAETGASDFGQFVNGPQDVVIAPDFGPFNAAAVSSAAIGGSSAMATSQQSSSITPVWISAQGSLTGSASASSLNAGGSAGMYNLFQVFFDVNSPQPYSLFTSLDGDLSGEVLGLVTGRIRLQMETPPFDVVLNRLLPPDMGPDTIMGTLVPGRYSLLAEFNAGGVLTPDADDGASFSATADYVVNLTVPEPSGCLLTFAAILLLLTARGSPHALRPATAYQS